MKKTNIVIAVSCLLGVSLNVNAACTFESTKAGNPPLVITATDKDTPEAKKFLETCINPYTEKFAADPEAAKAGKKKFGYYSCTQCHGANAGGQTGPSITDDRWQYPKHITDKGLFESIAGGTDAGMPAWHQQPSTNPELLSTDEILVIIGWLRASYSGGGGTPWLPAGFKKPAPVVTPTAEAPKPEVTPVPKEATPKTDNAAEAPVKTEALSKKSSPTSKNKINAKKPSTKVVK